MSGTLALYFGPRTISVAQAKGKKCLRQAQIPHSTIQPADFEEKVPQEAKIIELIALIKDEFRRNNIEAKEAVVCLSGKDLIIRTFEIPALPKEELTSAINFEARKYIPFKIEELISDYQVDLNKVSQANSVLFVGIKKETLDKYFSIFEQLGIKISAIEYSAFSLLRCLQVSRFSDKGIVGILGVGLQEQDETNFVVIENGFILFSRDIILTDRVAAPASTQATGVEPAPEKTLEKLKAEIRVSLDYYNRKLNTKNINKIYLFCSPDQRTELEAFISELGQSVQFVEVNKYTGQAAYSLSLIKSYSASLYRDISTGLKIDLIKARTKVSPVKEKTLSAELTALSEGLRIDFRSVALGALVCLAVFGFGFYRMMPLRKEFKDILSKRPKVVSISPEAPYQELSDKQLEYDRKLNTFDNLIKKQVYFTQVLDVIPRALPEGVWLVNFSLNKSAEGKTDLTIEGRAYLADSDQEFAAVNKFISNLKEDHKFMEYFKEVSVTSLDRRQERQDVTVTNFFVTCKSK